MTAVPEDYMPKQDDQRVREEPRISINKLGEYLTASPGRRRTILRDQKFPTYMAGRYSEATAAIVDFLVGSRNVGDLDDAEARLRRMPAQGGYDAQRLGDCADAVSAFRSVLDELDLDDVVVVAGEARPPQLRIANVDVSVRPEMLLESASVGAGRRVGLLKLYLAKTHPLDDAAGGYVSAVAQRFAAEHIAHRGTVHRSLVMVVDVFAGRVHVSPKAVTRRFNDVEAACEEIAARWKSL